MSVESPRIAPWRALRFHANFPSMASAAYDVDPVLAAAQRAPVVELTDEERALLDEVESHLIRWIPHEAFASSLRRDDER